MQDIPHTRFINFVDSPAVVAYSPAGTAQVQLDPQTGAFVDVTGYRSISIRTGPTSASLAELVIGKISGTTLAGLSAWTPDSQIHTFDVVGPQMALVLKGGQPNSTENLQLWVYLRS
ncbi:MAG TPA: hypothetical protein VKH43_03105 [Thermoanaerobaculia bacterium]|nr:hypothetical protein [Thermoanaerobaculia bacterium]